MPDEFLQFGGVKARRIPKSFVRFQDATRRLIQGDRSSDIQVPQIGAVTLKPGQSFSGGQVVTAEEARSLLSNPNISEQHRKEVQEALDNPFSDILEVTEGADLLKEGKFDTSFINQKAIEDFLGRQAAVAAGTQRVVGPGLQTIPAGSPADLLEQARAKGPEALAAETARQTGQPQAQTLGAGGAQVQPPAQQVTVKSGDTLSGIAQRLGVPLQSVIQANPQISNPDLIFPGQQVNVPGGGGVAPPAQTPPTGQPGQPGASQGPSGEPTFFTPIPGVEGPGIPRTGIPPEETPEDTRAKSTLQAFESNLGVSAPTESQFNFNPTGTIKDFVKEIMDALNLPDVNSQVTEITSEIEDLENQRDEEIREVNDNPFIGEGLRSRKVKEVQSKFEDRLNNRVNKLRLLEGVRDDARQSAQFAATTAISLFDKERRFGLDMTKFLQDQAEAELEAQRGFGRSSITEIGGRKVLVDLDTGEQLDLGVAPGEAANVQEEKQQFTDNQIREIAIAYVESTTNPFDRSTDEAKEIIRGGTIRVNNKNIVLSQRQIDAIVEKIDEVYPGGERGMIESILPF